MPYAATDAMPIAKATTRAFKDLSILLQKSVFVVVMALSFSFFVRQTDAACFNSSNVTKFHAPAQAIAELRLDLHKPLHLFRQNAIATVKHENKAVKRHSRVKS